VPTKRTQVAIEDEPGEETVADLDLDDAPVSEDLVVKLLELESDLKRGEEVVSAALWTEGDLLFAARLTEAQYRKIAQQTRISKDTLHEREHLARVFPPERRNPKVAWSIHKQLARIDKESVQDQLLRQRDDWTTASMRRAVHNWLERNGDGKGTQQVPAFRAGMSVGGIKVTGRRVADRIEISIEAPSSGKPQTTVTKNSVTLIAELNERKLRSAS